MPVSPSRPSWLARLPLICLASVALCGCELSTLTSSQDRTQADVHNLGLATSSSNSPFAAYHRACERLCVQGPQRCADPKALPSRLQAKLDDPQSQRACTALCVNERKLELAQALRFGLSAARCQHRANLATLCILNQDCQASPVLLENGELSLCNEAFQFALWACQGQSLPGILM